MWKSNSEAACASHPDDLTPGEYISLSVIDSGVGMRPEISQRIFEPFYTTRSNGTGLGLSITKKIIEEHGGRIAVESAAGRGSTFSVSLPADRHTGA